MTTRSGYISFLYELVKINKGFRDQAETIQIAKGKYELPDTLKGGIKKMIREWR